MAILSKRSDKDIMNINEFEVLNITSNNRYLTLKREHDVITINKDHIVQIGHGFRHISGVAVLVTTRDVYKLTISESLLKKLLLEA